MEVALGTTGLTMSWQEVFPAVTPCHVCGGEARALFTAQEVHEERGLVSALRENGGEGDYWPHDAIAATVYLCRACCAATALLNQA